MGFFSFGKKKKDVAPAKATNSPPVATPAKSHLRRPSNLINSASVSSSLSAASSGSSSGSPPQPIRSHTFSGTQDRSRRSLSFSPEALIPPVPRTSGPHSRAGSSTSLSAPNAPHVNRDLRKMGSTNTLNSIKSSASASKRGAHDAPRIAPELAALGTAKPRAYSYHASQVWVPSDAGHSTVPGHSTIQAPHIGTAKYYSTGSPGLMNRGSSYFNGQRSSLLPQHQQQHAAISDAEFKIYAKKYDMAIAKAHTLAREYHHLPPAKRDRPRFEHIGHAFTAAARISREQWSYRCQLEKERLQALLESTHGQPSDADIMGDEFSIHRVAGSRATEGWQYASMLADAWGMKEEVAEPLEEMPILKPNYATPTYSSSPSPSPSPYYYGDRSTAYLHPGYAQGGYASYIAQPVAAAASRGEFAIPKLPSRVRIDSSASAAPSLESHGHSSSSHTHSGLSHSLYHSQSHRTLSAPSPSASTAATTALSSYSVQSSYIPSPLKSTVVEETVFRAPIKLTKGKRYRERGNSLGGAATAVTVA